MRDDFPHDMSVNNGPKVKAAVRSLTTAMVVLLALVSAKGAPVVREEKALSIGIIVHRDAAGHAVLPHGEAFEVGITNHSDRPLKIWEEMCQPGHRALTFRVQSREADAFIAQKRDVAADVWLGELGYVPRTRTLPPKGGETRKVDFSDFFWGQRAWQNAPEPNGGEKVEIKAVFEIAASETAMTNGVWTGRVESSPVTVLVVNPKLKTPHDYIWNDCPRQALKVLKSDPAWIGRTDAMQCTPLHHAARFGPLEVVVWLVENGADVNARCYNQFTPLYFAAAFGKLETVKYLIKKGANLEAPSNGGTPIQAAAQSKNADIVQALLDAGASYDLETAISRTDEEGVRALLQKNPALARNGNYLHSACGKGHSGIVSLLLQHGADPGAGRRPWNETPLLWALSHPAVVKLLLEKGADPKVRLHIKGLPFGSTLLHEAARKGEVESARLLIDHGAEIEAVFVDEFMGKPAKETVFTPLHSAASGGQPKLVELLLERKADLRRRTSDGQTALQLAGAQINPADGYQTKNERYVEVIKILSARGLEVDLPAAIAVGNAERVAALLKARPDCIKDRSADGTLPLQQAVGMNRRPMVEQLLSAGADINGVGRYGRTPLIEAAFWGRSEMVRLLLDRGANPDLKGEREETALSEAERCLAHSPRKQDYEEVIQLLRERVRRRTISNRE